MKKRYFVSYVFYSDNQHGFGSIEMDSDRRANKYDVVKGFIQWLNNNIKDSKGAPVQCTVINFKRLAWWTL